LASTRSVGRSFYACSKISLIPAVGPYHKKRVEIGKDGNLSWIPGSPMPVTIASDMGVDAPEQKIAIGVPFALQPAK